MGWRLRGTRKIGSQKLERFSTDESFFRDNERKMRMMIKWGERERERVCVCEEKVVCMTVGT